MAAKHPTKRPMTADELAQRFSVTARTVRNIMAQPRDEFLAHSLTRAQPWQALGMSRATWYRRGKPAPPAQS